MPHKHFTIDGVATFVHHLGPTTLPGVVPDLSQGELVLCLHGAGGNGGAFAPLMQKLAARHSPLAFDQPGHGRSGGLDSLGSVERMRDFLRAFVDKLALRTPVLLGHSMGGIVALAYALAHPREVRALVLVGSGASVKIPKALVAAERLVVEGKARREFTRDAYSPSTSPEVVRQGIMEDLKTDPRVGLGDLLALQGWSAAERLGELRMPTLVAVGEDEFERLKAGSDALAAGIAGARKLVIPKAGHMLPLEQPQALAEAIDDFLAGLAR